MLFLDRLYHIVFGCVRARTNLREYGASGDLWWNNLARFSVRLCHGALHFVTLWRRAANDFRKTQIKTEPHAFIRLVPYGACFRESIARKILFWNLQVLFETLINYKLQCVAPPCAGFHARRVRNVWTEDTFLWWSTSPGTEQFFWHCSTFKTMKNLHWQS